MIIIDGDGFPNVKDISLICKKSNTPLSVYIDLNHELSLDYGKVFFIAPGTNSVDLVIQNNCSKGDIVLTNDYGVAVIALAKSCVCLNSNGVYYTNDNIDYLMALRHMNQKIRKHKNIKGPKKRTDDDKKKLLFEIEKLIGEENEKKY